MDPDSPPGTELYLDGDGRRVKRYIDAQGQSMEEVLLKDGSTVARRCVGSDLGVWGE